MPMMITSTRSAASTSQVMALPCRAARIADEQVLITRYNKPAAVLVGADWYGTITGEPVQREGGAS
jgi:PHD/YefM family antitoxin component YafN of YafNO toxin-antitoxin module